MKAMTFEEMEQVEGGITLSCGMAIAGLAVTIGSAPFSFGTSLLAMPFAVYGVQDSCFN